MTARSTAMAFVLALVLALALVSGGCEPDTDLPRTFINGPRVLAIKAEPPSVPPGGSTIVTTLIVGTGGETPVVSWVRCRRAPRPGEAINPDCVDTAQADYLEPIGDGPTITTTMPDDATASALGQPDATGSVYLPLVARVTVAGQTLIATYRLRLQSDGDANQNPVLTGLLRVDAAGTATPLDAAAPPVVRAGDQVTLQVAVADGSVETYPPPLGGAPVAEIVRTSWFSTAGTFSLERSEGPQASSVLQLDTLLPAPGNAIDVFAVIRDDRGGTDYVQRTLTFEQ
jgi:hypothetical protein